MSTLAIDIGGTKFSMAVFEGGRMLERASRATDREGGREWMLQQIAAVARDWGTHYQFQRCGIGFGGPVEFERQRIALSTHVGGWSDFDLPRHLERTLGLAPVMDNDANVGALGEALYGAGRGYRPLFYMTLSTGIGGGIIPSGEIIYRGADSYAGELGHIVIRPDGPECLCGWHGCFERMCGGLWLERDYGRPAEELLRDPEFVKRYVVDLAMGLKSAIMLLNPARIVIGGGISKAGDALFVPLRAELRTQITTWSRARIEVVPAALGDDSVLYGAMALAEKPVTGYSFPDFRSQKSGNEYPVTGFYPVLDTGMLARRGLSSADAAEAILEAGARILQFRHKGFFSRYTFEDAQRVAGLCRAAGALLVINDRVDIAMLLGAAVHLGQDDLAPADARKMTNAIIGFSTHNEQQLRAGDGEPVDYLAIGPIFPTASKQHPDPTLGIQQLRSLRTLTRKPLVAIGGITRATAGDVLQAGADSIAVIGDLYPDACTKASLRARAEEWMAIFSSRKSPAP
jgi:thiamine-phosphate diphosphorylase